jgi:hypothetical protein
MHCNTYLSITTRRFFLEHFILLVNWQFLLANRPINQSQLGSGCMSFGKQLWLDHYVNTRDTNFVETLRQSKSVQFCRSCLNGELHGLANIVKLSYEQDFWKNATVWIIQWLSWAVSIDLSTNFISYPNKKFYWTITKSHTSKDYSWMWCCNWVKSLPPLNKSLLAYLSCLVLGYNGFISIQSVQCNFLPKPVSWSSNTK